jgi:hypothetical protein
VQKTYQARLFAVSLGVSLLLPFAAQGAIADPSVPTVRQLAGDRFQLPNPMSREYMDRSVGRPAEAPGQVQPPATPRRQSETN